MRAFGILCLWLLLSGFTPGQQIVALNPQVRPDNASAGLPAVDDNWANGGYPYAGGVCAEWGHRVPCYNHQSTTRASTAYCTQMDGTLVLVGTGVLRQCNGNGALIEEARTNVALWSRDLTNAAWTKSNTTAALDQTGADGVANSASSLTAAAGNGTALQAITLASSARFQSVYMKRVTGSGNVDMTTDNGSTWTTVSGSINSTGYTRVTIATQTLANPTVGFRIVTNGDKVAVDFSQNENGAFVTSPIPTTTVSVTRAADNVSFSGAAFTLMNAAQGSHIANIFGEERVPNGSQRVWSVNGDTDRLSLQSDTTARQFNNAVNLTATLGSGGYTTTAVKNGFSWDGTGRSLVGNNGATATDANTRPGGATTINLGGANAASLLDAYVTRYSIWAARLPDATLKAMTQ